MRDTNTNDSLKRINTQQLVVQMIVQNLVRNMLCLHSFGGKDAAFPRHFLRIWHEIKVKG